MACANVQADLKIGEGESRVEADLWVGLCW
jgi:hypothetical protein